VANNNPPVCEVSSGNDGGPIVRAWRNGQFTLTPRSGRKLQADVSGLPQPQEISGVWNVRFEPGRGAPDSVPFQKLISWPEHTNTGVRYFSGTAGYEKEISVSPDLLAADREIWLDLGQVKNIAEVSLNGQNLGVLWKPPFRVNITSAARPGTNSLVVK